MGTLLALEMLDGPFTPDAGMFTRNTGIPMIGFLVPALGTPHGDGGVPICRSINNVYAAGPVSVHGSALRARPHLNPAFALGTP
jgi:hypothetical protein